MTDASNTETNEVFNSEKPSKLKLAFEVAGSFLGGLSGDGTVYGWNQGAFTYDYLKVNGYLGGASKPAATQP